MANIIDVRTWNVGTVRWAELPRPYVAAYLQHQVKLELTDEPAGLTFREMFDNSTAEGKVKLVQMLGMGQPEPEEEESEAQLTAAQREFIVADIIENCPTKVFRAKLLGDEGNEADILESLGDEMARPLVIGLVEKIGFSAALNALVVYNDDGNTFSDEFESVLASTPELGKAYRTAGLEYLKKEWDENDLEDMLVRYAETSKLELPPSETPGVVAVAGAQQWVPTWEEFEAHLRNYRIKSKW